MSAYCEVRHVYEWIPRGSVSPQRMLVSEVGVAANTLTVNGHGLELNDELVFRAEAGGTLPTGLVAGTTYYAIPQTDSTFKVSASSGGAAVDITAAGENVVVIPELPWTRWIASASAELENTLPAHIVPMTAPYPEVVITYTAGLVAEKALVYSGQHTEILTARFERVQRELDRWRKGVPLRGATVPTSANLAVRGTPTVVDSRGWVSSYGDGFIP